MAEWYKDWFNSDAYQKVYAHRDDSEADGLISFLVNYLSLPAGCSVLDICCGAGRHSIAFGKRGFSVTGIDLSENLLCSARNRSEGMSNISFQKQDILHFIPLGVFDLVVNLFTSFGYFATDALNFTLFMVAAQSLAPGGNFVFDYVNKNYLEKHLVPFSAEKRDGMIIEQFRWIEDAAVRKSIVLQAETSLLHFAEYVKLYSKDQISGALFSAGFKNVTFFGDYEGNAFDELNSPRLLAVCKF